MGEVDRLYVFGDSYSDIGYRYRDCNGPTAVAYFAREMGLELTHIKAPDWQGHSLDFASSGAVTGETVPGSEPSGMVTQARISRSWW